MAENIGEIIQKIDAGGIEVMREVGFFAFKLTDTRTFNDIYNDSISRAWGNSSFRENSGKIQVYKKIFIDRESVAPYEGKAECTCGNPPTVVLLWLIPKDRISIRYKNGMHWPALACLECGVIIEASTHPKRDDGWQWARPEPGHPIRGDAIRFDGEKFQTNRRAESGLPALRNNKHSRET